MDGYDHSSDGSRWVGRKAWNSHRKRLRSKMHPKSGDIGYPGLTHEPGALRQK